MPDFLIISAHVNKNCVDIAPTFRLYPKSHDLMIRGGDFYAIWIAERGLWSMNEDDALSLIDSHLARYAEEYRVKNPEAKLNIQYTWDTN